MPTAVAGLAGDDLDMESEDLRAAEQLHRRQVSEEQLRKFESYAAEIFTAFGLDLNTPATRYASAAGVAKGAYVLADADNGQPHVLLLGRVYDRCG